MIKIIEVDILDSVLETFKNRYIREDDSYFEAFRDSFYELIKDDVKLSNSINSIKESNESIENYIKDLRVRLTNLINSNQKTLEEYNELITQNNRLSRVNSNKKTANSQLLDDIGIYESSINEYEEDIVNLNRDLFYYKNILENLSLITNIMDNDSYKLSEVNNFISIEASPYYRIIEQSNQFDKSFYIDSYLTVDGYYNEDINPIEHFINVGCNLDYNPNEDFDTKWYRMFYLDDDYNLNPFVDYLSYGRYHNRHAHVPFNKYDDVDFCECHEYLLDESAEFTSDMEFNEDDDQLFNVLFESDLLDDTSLICEDDMSKSFENIYNHLLESFDDTSDYSVDVGFDISDSVEYNILYEDSLFDCEYYLNTYQDVKNAGVNPIVHYLKSGYKENRNPSKGFNSSKFREEYPNVTDNPLISFIYMNKNDFSKDSLNDIVENSQEYAILDDERFFDRKFYLSTYTDVANSDVNPLIHFIRKGVSEHRNPKESVDIEVIASQVDDCSSNEYVKYVLDVCCNSGDYDLEKVVHDEEYCRNYSLLDESIYFDNDYYIAHNPNLDVEDDAVNYYLTEGFREDYPTSKYFSPSNYLDLNPDLRVHNVNPLIHFINSGLKEKRPYKRPKLSFDELDDEDKGLYEQYLALYDSKLFDEAYYVNNTLGLDEDPILHYLKYGVELSLNPSSLFSTKRYLDNHGDIRRTGFNPLYHYLTNGIKENRSIFLPQEYFPNNFLERYDYLTALDMYKGLNTKISIILEYNENRKVFENVLRAILENTSFNYELYILSDKIHRDYLDGFGDIVNVNVVYFEDDRTLTRRNVISSIDNDMVFLDNTVIVTPKWLSKLTYSAYCDSRVGFVSALSNASNLLDDDSKSVLDKSFNEDFNRLYDFSKKVEVFFNDNYIESIAGDANCLYVKHEAVKDYEFSDISDVWINAYEDGWICLRNNSVLVYDYERDKSVSENLLSLDVDNGLYDAIEVKKLNSTIQNSLNDRYVKSRRRILAFTQVDNGRVVLDDNIRRLSNKYDVYVLALDLDKYYIYRYSRGILSVVDNSKVDFSFSRNFYFKSYINLLVNLKIDLLYTKTFKQLYHPTNRNFISLIEMVRLFGIEEVHEAVYRDLNVVECVDDILSSKKSFDELVEIAKNRIDFDNKKVVVYTAVTGTYDEPIIPSYVDNRFDYICFTDNPNLKSDFWTVKVMDESNLDRIRKVRMYKILPHRFLDNYDYSIWMDTNFEITGDITEYINRYSNKNKLLAIKHEDRNCIYQEAEGCITSSKDSPEVIRKQMQEYRNKGYPEHNGLIASGILFRKHDDEEVIKVMEEWYAQITKYSYRDQLSFNYACWKNDFKYDEARIFYLKNPYFQRHDHLKNGYILRTNRVDYNKDYDLQYEIDDINNTEEAFAKKTSIIIEINDIRHTRETLDSIIKYTNTAYEVILINNKKDDINVKNLLDEYKDNENIKIITNDVENDYITNINIAVKESSDDIVLLKNNTVVTAKWLEKIKQKAYSNSEYGSISCLTNTDSHYTLDVDDKYLRDNLNSIADSIEKKSQNNTIVIPSSSNTCMYIKRDAIYNTGFFDVRFKKGYYSDCDYSRRLRNRGWHNVLDCSTFIYHYPEDIDDNVANENKRIIYRQYPEYKKLEEEYEKSIELKQEIEKINYGLKSKNKNKKRILYAIHQGTGGTLHTSIELMKHIDEDLETYLLVTDTKKIELYKYESSQKINHLDEEEFKNNINLFRTWKLKNRYTQTERSIANIKQIYFNLLVYLHIDIIHIRHLIKSTLDLPNIANFLKIPVILSFHDFYYICPSHNLIDDNRKYCGGICPPLYEKSALGGQCNIVGDLNIPPARLIVHKWRDDVKEMFKNIDAFVTTCQSAYDMYTHFYPQLKDKDFRIIEHGRDVKTPDTTKYLNKLDKNKIKIVFPGHLSHTKGYELIKGIKEYDVDNRLEFHYMGSLGGHDDLKDVGIDHGTYNRSEFNKIIHEIKPHFIALFSIWPETYCHTLTEGWASGIPILTIDIGALGERVKTHGGGFFVENNPQKAYERILEIAEDEENYAKKGEEITKIKFKTTRQMSNEYLEMYKEYLKD